MDVNIKANIWHHLRTCTNCGRWRAPRRPSSTSWRRPTCRTATTASITRIWARAAMAVARRPICASCKGSSAVATFGATRCRTEAPTSATSTEADGCDKHRQTRSNQYVMYIEHIGEKETWVWLGLLLEHPDCTTILSFSQQSIQTGGLLRSLNDCVSMVESVTEEYKCPPVTQLSRTYTSLSLENKQKQLNRLQRRHLYCFRESSRLGCWNAFLRWGSPELAGDTAGRVFDAGNRFWKNLSGPQRWARPVRTLNKNEGLFWTQLHCT